MVMSVDEKDEVKLRFPECTKGSEPMMRYETVGLFSGRIAPLGAYGHHFNHQCIPIGKVINTGPAIVLDSTLRDSDSPLKNLSYQLDRDWTIVFRDIGVMLPDVQLKMVEEGTVDISGTFLETGERFDGRAVYQYDDRFLV